MLVGIVGKPSCGKSTFFKSSTLAEVDIANYPFTTIKPNHAVGFVKVKDPASDFNKKSNPRMGYVAGSWRFVPCDLIDVAGLVPGAHAGEGMGVQFLNDLNQADALIHVIDISGSVNARGEAVDVGAYDPLLDVKFLEDELDFWYLEIMKKGWDKFVRAVTSEKGDFALALEKQLSGVRVTEHIAKEALRKLGFNLAQAASWSEEQLHALASELRKASKPMLIAANKIDRPGAYENYLRLKKEFPHYLVIPCSAELELALKEANKHQVIEYIPGEGSFTILKAESELQEKQKMGLQFIKDFLEKYHNTGVQQVLNTAVFELLKYKAIYPGGVGKLEDSNGNVIPDCFLLAQNATALDFAYRLHTDFGKNFIKAINVRTKLPIGKDAILSDGDIVEIMAK